MIGALEKVETSYRADGLLIQFALDGRADGAAQAPMRTVLRSHAHAAERISDASY
jgi:hypothetical protein